MPAALSPVLAATAVDTVVFIAAAAVILSGALGVVSSRNPVHSALSLVLTLFGVAVLFVAQDAQFLAAVQVIVYAGAIVVLFLFVIMLIGVDREEDVRADPLRGQRPAAFALGALGLAELLGLARFHHWVTGAPSAAGAASGPGSNVEKLARSVFTRYLLPFEVTSVLLVIAVVGAVVLASLGEGRRYGSADLGDAQELVGRYEAGEAEGGAPEEPERAARADDDLGRRRGGALGLAARAPEGVGVVARDARVGETAADRVLDALDAPPERRHAAAVAARARVGDRHCPPAESAGER